MSRPTISRRPTTLAEYKQANENFSTEQGRAYGRSFQLEPTDVVITPYGKSGTTWLQQIVHGLRTRGDMDFDDISRVVPWIECSYDLGLDLYAPQRGHPRAFKSHKSYHDVVKGGRYIVSIRNPKDVLVSMYRFMEGWWFETGSISITEYAQDYLDYDEGGAYWGHLLSWWPQRYDENVLLMCYETMINDLPGTVGRVANFIGIPLDDELLEIVVRQSSLEFMLAHKNRFDDFLIRERSEKVCGLPPGSDSTKVRKGLVGSHAYELTPEINAELDRIWAKEIEPTLGFPTYEALAAELGP
ncbi:MAG: sulfotransferase domain-containing protein [Chloroflexota bacterium]